MPKKPANTTLRAVYASCSRQPPLLPMPLILSQHPTAIKHLHPQCLCPSHPTFPIPLAPPASHSHSIHPPARFPGLPLPLLRAGTAHPCSSSSWESHGWPGRSCWLRAHPCEMQSGAVSGWAGMKLCRGMGVNTAGSGRKEMGLLRPLCLTSARRGLEAGPSCVGFKSSMGTPGVPVTSASSLRDANVSPEATNAKNYASSPYFTLVNGAKQF